MKKQIVILLVLVSTGAMAFAGSNDKNSDRSKRDNNNDRNGNRTEMSERNGDRMEEFLEDATIVTMSGTLNLENGEMATLVSGKTTYTIMAPYTQLIELGVKDGLKVTVEGVERVSPMVWDGSEKMFIVTKITIAGKTTEIDHTDRESMRGMKGMRGEKGSRS